MIHVKDVLTRTNWPLLAQQKLGLLRAIDLAEAADKAAGLEDPSDTANALNGILNWMDNLQDAAEADGFPVVFLTEPEEENA